MSWGGGEGGLISLTPPTTPPQPDIEYWEVDLQPGDFIFVPSNAPHQILNLAAVNVAVSMNYVSWGRVGKVAIAPTHRRPPQIDNTNLADLIRHMHEAPAFHDTRRLRLRKAGKIVDPEDARWFGELRPRLTRMSGGCKGGQVARR